MAAIIALAGLHKPIEIRSDSEYVVRGAIHYLEHGQLRRHDGNHDLWITLRQQLQKRRPGEVHFVWVMGHAKESDVKAGRTTALDKMGNDAADALATRGAALHAPPAELVEQAQQRRQNAETIQSLFMTLIKERRKAENELNLHVSIENDLGEGMLLPEEECMPETENTKIHAMINPRCLPSETEPG